MSITPDGSPPIMLSQSQWEAFERAGLDMRWFALIHPIPVSEAHPTIYRREESSK